MILRRRLATTLRSCTPFVTTTALTRCALRPARCYPFRSPPSSWLRSFSVASSSASAPSIPGSNAFSTSAAPVAPAPPALATPQTLSSLELISAEHLVQRETVHLQAAARTRRRSLAQEAGFRAINDHGLIGDCRTSAMVGLDGCIDWYCYPHMDSPSVFAALVDSQVGGHFSVRPLYDGPPYHEQRYEADTNVLVTTITNVERERQKKSTERRWKPRPIPGARPQDLSITDFLPVSNDPTAPGTGWLVRQLHCKRGPIEADIQVFPAFDYAQAQQTVEIGKGGVKFLSKDLSMVLSASCPVQWTLSANKRGVFGRVHLEEGQTATLVFRELAPEEVTGAIDPAPLAHSASLLERTRDYWLEWMEQCTYRGRWASSVRRSALALKLLFFAPEGSCVASPTTSLPETLGGVRNWDYRYAWIRDTSFIIAALLRLGFHEESRAFIGWLQRRAADMRGGVHGHGLQALYGLRGEQRLTERELPHLRGYLHSRPVRIGNGAWNQIQLDIYGEMLETVWLAHVKGARLMDLDLWKSLRPCIDWIVAHRQDRDEGIWEVRGGKQSFTYSRLMIWTALDRAIKLAEELQRTYAESAHEQPTAVQATPDLSEYGGGHQRSAAVQRAQQREESDSEAAPPSPPPTVLQPRAGSGASDGAFTVLGSTLTSPDLPSSQRLAAKSESAAFMSAIDVSAPSSPQSVLPPDLCEGCAPAPGSPEASHSAGGDGLPVLSSSSFPASGTEAFPGLLTSDLEWWRSVRTSLVDQLMNQGYNEKRQSFVQHVATPPHPCTCSVLDAACLAFPLYGFLPPDHERIRSTLNAILAPIGEGGLMQNHLVYRYNVSHTNDGFGGAEEGTFGLCTAWSIEGLAKVGRTGDDAALQRAEVMIEQYIGLSNHLDLYSEELLLHRGKMHKDGATSTEQRQKGVLKDDSTAKVDWDDVDPNDVEDDDTLYEEESDAETRYLQIGNFVQGFSHLAFVNAALELNTALDEREARARAAAGQDAPQQRRRAVQSAQS